MDYLELSVPIAVSGKFIALHKSGFLQKAQPLWNQYFRLSLSLDGVNRKLRMCNEPAWLFQFARQRQNQDFEKQLRLLVDALEKKKAAFEERRVDIYARLLEIDTSISEEAHSLVGGRFLYDFENSNSVLRRSDAVLRRDGIVAKNPNFTSLELCKRFDGDNIPLPDRWEERFPEVTSWVLAYANKRCRKLIHKMISDAKRRLRLP